MLCICKLSVPLFSSLVPQIRWSQLDWRFWSRALLSIPNTHSKLWKPRWSTLLAWCFLHHLQTSMSPNFPTVISRCRKMWRTMKSRSQEDPNRSQMSGWIHTDPRHPKSSRHLSSWAGKVNRAAFSRNHLQHKNKYYMKFKKKAYKTKPQWKPPIVPFFVRLHNL